MKYKNLLLLFVFALSALWACQNNQRHINLISPSGKLLARNTQEIRDLLAKIHKADSNATIKIININYDSQDSITTATVNYIYNNKKLKMLIYINDYDPQCEGSLLENSKIKVFVAENQPVVVVLTKKSNSNSTQKDSTCR